MSAMSPAKVRIHPVPGVTLYPWKPIAQDVTPEQWAELQKYRPQPFTAELPPAPGTKPVIPKKPTGSSDGKGAA